MKTYRVLFEKAATRTLSKMDRAQANLIVGWITKNLDGCENPRLHGKALQGNHRDKWRYRVGDYRLIAHISDTEITILILNIGHRRDIYKR